MYCDSLKLQSHYPPNIPILFNSSSETLSESSKSYPQSLIRIAARGRRRNRKRRIQWQRAVEPVRKCISAMAWNLRPIIESEPLGLILDNGGGWGGGGLGFWVRKGFGGGGGFERRRWRRSVLLFGLGVGLLLLIVLGRYLERDSSFARVLVWVVMGCWIRVWRRKWGLEFWGLVLGISALMAGLWREGGLRLENFSERLGSLFSSLERVLMKRRRKRWGF